MSKFFPRDIIASKFYSSNGRTAIVLRVKGGKVYYSNGVVSNSPSPQHDEPGHLRLVKSPRRESKLGRIIYK